MENKYYGNWRTNSGNTVGQIRGNNLRKLRKDLREIVAVNLSTGEVGSWSITSYSWPVVEVAHGSVVRQ